MISRTVANSVRTTVRHQMPTAAANALPDLVKQVAKQAKATPELAKQVTKQAANVPTESTWYQIKKKIIHFISNIDYNKAKVHAVTEDMAVKVQSKLQPGDVLLRRTEGTSGNWFIPSWWKHAGVYVGKGEVVESTFKGINRVPFKSFMTEGDAALVVRAKHLSPEQRKKVAHYAELQIGKPYDFDFNFSDEARQSCTELANHAVKAGAGKELVAKNWIGSVTGDAFKNENFKLVWSSKPEKAKWKF